jgi:hypothetical protein
MRQTWEFESSEFVLGTGEPGRAALRADISGIVMRFVVEVR